MIQRTADDATPGLTIAVVGSGISGLSAAWLIARDGRHRVSLFEAAPRIGGHSHTVDAAGVAVDTGFIVYNEATYPNLTALFAYLNVPTKPAEMSFAVSLDRGRLEYGTTDIGSLFAQRRNLLRPRFWAMLRDLVRFYARAPRDLAALGDTTLGAYLDRIGCGRAFRDDHLYPMAAAIWSTPVCDIPGYPAAAFIRFCQNHGLLKLGRRPIWRTIDGGSREYVHRIVTTLGEDVSVHAPVHAIRRPSGGGATLEFAGGGQRCFDAVVIATHADQALRLLADPDAQERSLLGAFGYRGNDMVLHADARVMPARRRTWSSWNYAAESRDTGGPALSVTYWMNRLQGVGEGTPLFVTLNPLVTPDPALVFHRERYDHPVFDAAAIAAQRRLWDLQGTRDTWFCGAYFGAGFHEDGLQAGLAVAEQLGGVRRPWQVADESGRIHVGPVPTRSARAAA